MMFEQPKIGERKIYIPKRVLRTVETRESRLSLLRLDSDIKQKNEVAYFPQQNGQFDYLSDTIHVEPSEECLKPY